MKSCYGFVIKSVPCRNLCDLLQISLDLMRLRETSETRMGRFCVDPWDYDAIVHF